MKRAWTEIGLMVPATWLLFGAALIPAFDPGTVAPALDAVAVSNLGSSTRFLYTGAQPIQTGVSNTAIRHSPMPSTANL